MPKTLFVLQRKGVRADPSALGQPTTVYLVRERLIDFEDLRDETVWEFRAVGPVKLTINWKPGKPEKGAIKL